jgi:DNA-binding transcriptional LysR family regulator
MYQLRRATLEVADRHASILSVVATHALSFVFFPRWIRSHPLFDTLGPLNLISDTMEACEHIMLRGEADFLLCHYHRNGGTLLESNQFASVPVGTDVLLPVCAPDANGAPRWSLPGRSERPWPFLSYDPKSGLGRILTAVWAKDDRALACKKRVTAQLAVALLCMARQGEGVAWVPNSLAADDIETGRLIDPGFGRFSIDVEIRLFRRTHRLAGSAEEFWKAVAKPA